QPNDPFVKSFSDEILDFIWCFLETYRRLVDQPGHLHSFGFRNHAFVKTSYGINSHYPGITLILDFFLQQPKYDSLTLGIAVFNSAGILGRIPERSLLRKEAHYFKVGIYFL